MGSLPVLVTCVTLITQLSSTVCQRLAIYPISDGTHVRPLGGGTIFTCAVEEYSGEERPIMFWQTPSGDSVTSNSGRLHVERNSMLTHKLYISRVEAGDAGLYTCECVINGTTLSVDVQLEIYEDITIRESPSVVQVEVGDSPLLECTATGRPQPTISWRVNRKHIISDGVRYQYEARGLRLYNVRTEDAGTYECKAEVRSHGNLKIKVITLDVRYAPILSQKPPESLSLIEGSRAEIICRGSANPPPKYEWFQELQAGDFAKVKVKLREESDTYVIESPNKDDGGEYFCRLSNELGTVEAHTGITVLVPAQVDPLPSLQPLELSAVILTCSVRGDPEPTVTWQRLGHPVFQEGEQPTEPRITVDSTLPGVSKLIIQEVQRSDSGQYTCSASNSAGNDSKTSDIAVEFSPSINMTDGDKYGWPGQVRNFTCSGYGRPLPTLSWLLEGQYISDSDTYTVYTQTGETVVSTLQITIGEKESWLYGSYSCMAKNKYNYIPAYVDLIEAKAPGMVASASLDEDSPTAVKLTVELPKEERVFPVTSYKVQYEAAKEDDLNEGEQTHYFDIDEDVYVDGLHPGVLYTFSVSAGNEVGYGEPVLFQVETREPKEQADPPVADTDEAQIHRTGSSSKESAKYNVKLQEVQSDTSDPDPAVPPTVAIAVGITVGIAVLVLITAAVAISVRRRNRRKQDDYTKTWKGMFRDGRKPTLSDHEGTMVKISENKDIDQIQLEIRRLDGSHTDGPIAHPSPKPTHVDKCRSPFEIRKNGNVPRLGSPASNGTIDTLQARAWDQMLLKQALQEEEPSPPPPDRPDELTPMVDLPPPPPFLLDNQENPGGLPQSDSVSYHDILDGYHSEENIDDGEHYEIRLPHANSPPSSQNHHYC